MRGAHRRGVDLGTITRAIGLGPGTVRKGLKGEPTPE